MSPSDLRGAPDPRASTLRSIAHDGRYSSFEVVLFNSCLQTQSCVFPPGLEALIYHPER